MDQTAVARPRPRHAAVRPADDRAERAGVLAPMTGPNEPSRRTKTAWALTTMLLAMSPAILLGIVYPLASSRMSGHTVGGVEISSLIVSVSVAVPWLSQAACTPVYRLLGDSIARGPEAVTRRFARVWPVMLAFSAIPVLVVALLVSTTTDWSSQVMAAHVLLAMENMVFVQSLIVADVVGRRRRWALGWLVYAAAVIIAPTLWYLPPLLAAVSQIALMGRGLAELRHPVSVELRPYVADMMRGTILGGVLWADKLFLFLTLGTHWDIVLAYLCLQPAVVAYTFYFAITSPRVNQAIERFHHELQSSSIDAVHAGGQRLRALLDRAVIRTGLVAVVGLVVALVLTEVIEPRDLLTVAVVATGSALLALLTLLCYEIDHAGDPRTAMLLSGVHLIVAALAFTTIGGLVASFAVTAVVDVLLVGSALSSYRARWSAPEYSFFWGKALSW